MSENINNEPVYIIAEIGVNHNGDVELAREMMKIAKRAGASAVKFQTYKADLLASRLTPKVEYQKKSGLKGESHYEMLKKFELSYGEFVKLRSFSREIELDFISTPYDIESARFLKEIEVDAIKIASADLADLSLNNFAAQSGMPVLVATGMSELDEVVLVEKIYANNSCKDVTFLHCVSNYPCSDMSLNMKSIEYLQKKISYPVGFSDHSVGNTASILAVAMGVKKIEKHFTLDKLLKGPDHAASSTPEEFESLVQEIRRAEKMLGVYGKHIQPEEIEMRNISRKSIHLARALPKGAVISIDDLKLMRPGTGLMPKMIPDIVGKIARTHLPLDHLLSFNDFE